MTLFIACLLISLSGLSNWWYVIAVWLWAMTRLPRWWSAINNADPDS